MYQENIFRLGGKYSDCVPDDADWQDLRHGKVITITKEDGERYNRKVLSVKLFVLSSEFF